MDKRTQDWVQAAQAGDEVQYSADFCRNVFHCLGDGPQMRGRIAEISVLSESTKIARVEWRGNFDESWPTKVNVANLAKIGSLRSHD